jgi:hypothetical protein
MAATATTIPTASEGPPGSTNNDRRPVCAQCRLISSAERPALTASMLPATCRRHSRGEVGQQRHTHQHCDDHPDRIPGIGFSKQKHQNGFDDEHGSADR